MIKKQEYFIRKLIREHLDKIKVFDESRKNWTSKTNSSNDNSVGNNIKTFKADKMDAETYNKRRMIMKYIYEARNLNKSQARINVLIGNFTMKDYLGNDMKSTILGCASFGTHNVWFPDPEKIIKDGYNLKAIVFHEVLHAAHCVLHNKNSPLMNAFVTRTPIPDLILDELFLSHIDCKNNDEWDAKYAQKFEKYL